MKKRKVIDENYTGRVFTKCGEKQKGIVGRIILPRITMLCVQKRNGSEQRTFSNEVIRYEKTMGSEKGSKQAWAEPN